MVMKKGKVDKQGKSMVASYRYLGVSNPGLQMIGSNECYVSSPMPFFWFTLLDIKCSGFTTCHWFTLFKKCFVSPC